MIEGYTNSYIDRKIIITGNNDDCILSCDVSYPSIYKTLLSNKNVKTKDEALNVSYWPQI
jgi:hypothetical protein